MANSTLNKAKQARKDEFYTQYESIQKELINYKEQLRGKTVYCNCDDPNKSNFVKYFIDNFSTLGLKKLIVTHYVDPQTTTIKPQKLVLTQSTNAEGFIREVTTLNGDGDFRSEECLQLLRECDIVITNPPFSLWTQFVELILAYNKKFLILGIVQAANYKPMQSGIIAGTIQAGYTSYNKSMRFAVPENYDSQKVIDGLKFVTVTVCWWTNLSVVSRPHMKLTKHYTPEEYPKYVAKNSKITLAYDAINVGEVAKIPCDYEGFMGVPITMLGKINYDQFEIIGFLNNGFICGKSKFTRLIIKHKKFIMTKTVTRQGTQSYTSTMGGVCMNAKGQEVNIIHTTPKMTNTERKTAEKRVSNDLYNVLSDIYKKLNS